jgi:superfamily I DNA and/or RNA helicase
MDAILQVNIEKYEQKLLLRSQNNYIALKIHYKMSYQGMHQWSLGSAEL